MSPLRRVWAAPAAIGAATAIGLTSALLFDGRLAQAAACLALAVPVGAVLWKLRSADVRERRKAVGPASLPAHLRENGRGPSADLARGPDA